MTTTFSGETFDYDEMYASPFASPFAEQPAAYAEQPAPYAPAGGRPCGCRQEAAGASQLLAEPAQLVLAHESPVQAKPDAGDLWVPGAERVANPRSAGGTYLPAPWRFVFHTIEGEPSADGFRRLAAEHTNAPHLWAMPSANLLLQTIPLNRSAYALARPGSVQTNRLHAVQVEVWGFAAKMGSLHQHAIEWLAERLLAPVARLVPINLDRVRPTGGVSCYGRASQCRMTAETWQSFDGICGHQHVPDNEHWDPGDMPVAAIAARARQLVGGGIPRREQLADHDGPSFAAETAETAETAGAYEAHGPYETNGPYETYGTESWAGGVEQLTPTAGAPSPPRPPLSGPVDTTRNCCLLDPKSLKDMTTMGGYATPGGPNSGVPGTIYTSKAGFVDLGHLFAVANATGAAYQQIYAKNGAVGTVVATPHGTATLTAAAPAAEWVELARSIAYDDSVAYEIQTFKGMGYLPQNQSYFPGNLNSSFSPEDLCSNYLGTVVAGNVLKSGSSTSGMISFAGNVNNEVRQLLMGLGAQSAADALRAFTLINGRWVDWSNLPLNAAAASPFYLKRRNFTYNPWLAGLPTDQPGWAPTPFALTGTYYTYRHTTGFTNADFPKEIAAARTWALGKFGPNADKP
jgi:hypothetical protein